MEVGTSFSTEAMRERLSNHCLPILEIPITPISENPVILVHQDFHKLPSFVTIGETIDFIRQILEVPLVWFSSTFSYTNSFAIHAFSPCFSSLEATLDSPGWGAADPTIPEFTQNDDCTNQFAVDVYCIQLDSPEIYRSNGLPSLRYCAMLTL